MPFVRLKALIGWRVLVCLLLASPVAVLVDGFVAASPAQAQAIRDIRVLGNRRVEPETVRSYLQFSIGDAYDAGKVDRSLKALFATGLFADVRIDRDGAAIVVTVVENPVINQVAFEGNSEVDTATLATEVQLKPRSVYTRARVQADVQRILDVYRRQGRFAASVEPKMIELEQNRVNLIFEIVEGSATKVKGIYFIGNQAFSDSQLRDIVTTTETGWFDFLKGTSIYDPDRMSLDRELLRQYYLKNGYADAKVIAANAELDRDGSGFFINFTVEEGELYSFGEMRIESALPEVNPDRLRGELLTSAGSTYNASAIDKTVERLTLLIAEQGYAFARVRPRAIPDPVSRTIAITYANDEGPRIYIERINIVGNGRTKDYVIRREFRLAEGDAFNPMLIDRAKKRLQGLGLFKTVDVKRRPGSAQDRIVLDVEVVEQPTGELSFGAGYSTAEGIIGDITIAERNLLGNGQFLRLRLGGSFERFQVDLSFTEPRFLDMNLAAGFDLFHKEIDQLDQSGFRSRKSGGGLRLGFPLSENLWMQTSYNLSYDDLFDVRDQASFVVKQSEGSYLTSSFGTSIAYDLRNHPKNPTKGVYFQLAGDFAGAGGDVKYVRLTGEGRGYYPITDKITLVGRAIGGHIAGWGGDDVRLLDMFFKGGETVRGFDRAGYGPRDLNTNDALGGATFWAVTAEVRMPIPMVPDDLGMSWAIFADAGSLFGAGEVAKNANQECNKAIATADDVCLEDSSSIRASVGVSLMWTSPVGPIRFDFAKTLVKEAYDEEQFFRFGASTKF